MPVNISTAWLKRLFFLHAFLTLTIPLLISYVVTARELDIRANALTRMAPVRTQASDCEIVNRVFIEDLLREYDIGVQMLIEDSDTKGIALEVIQIFALTSSVAAFFVLWSMRKTKLKVEPKKRAEDVIP